MTSTKHSDQAMKTWIVRTGIGLSLVLLLFAPVLIWSPPWNNNGYYIISSHTYWQWQQVHMVHIYNNSIQRGTISGEGIFFKSGTEIENKKDEVRKFKTNYIYLKTISNFTLESFPDPTTKPDPRVPKFDPFIFNKTMNPFSVWHIKWLEWTSR